MTDVEIFNSDFTSDPGILFSSAIAQTNRPYDGTGQHWDARFENSISETAWAYIKTFGPRSGLTDYHSFYFENRHVITAAQNGAQAFIALHHDPTGKTAPDMENLVGYRLRQDGSGNRLFNARIRTDASVIYNGNDVNVGAVLDYDIEATYNKDTRQLEVKIYNHSGHVLIGTSTLNLPAAAHFKDLTVFGTRDHFTSDAATPFIDGYIDDLTIDWTIPEDEWVLFVPTHGTVILKEMRLWNKDHPPRNTIVTAQGRPWSSIYWDGAGPLAINLEGTLQRDYDVLNDIDDLLVETYSNGYPVELYSPEPNYTMLDAKMTFLNYPREVQRTDNRDFVIQVSSRREPTIS